MPYIANPDRLQFDKILDQIIKIESKGYLEYCIFKLMKIYMKDRKLTYTELHNTTYAAQHCADEFRRRYLDEREDQAIMENGDI